MLGALRLVRLCLVALLAAIAVPAARAAERVDLLLVFAVDVSRSIDAAKFQLQRDGYVAAINNPRVIEAIRRQNFAEAVRRFESAIDLDARAVPAYLNLGAYCGDEHRREILWRHQFHLDELMRTVLKAHDDRRRVVTDPRALYFGAPLDERTLVPGERGTIYQTRFADWLALRMSGAVR